MADHRARARAPGGRDVTKFAISSIDRVRGIADAIFKSGDNAAKPFCRNLRNALYSVKTELQRQNQSQEKAQQEKVKSLLKNLERLCIWPSPSRPTESSSWPTLTALESEKSRNKAKECIRELAVDPRQTDYKNNAITKLKEYPAATWKQEAAEVAQNNDASATSPAPHQSHELDEDIKSLYKVLKQYRSCQNDPLPSEIVTNLRLNGYRSLTAGGAPVEFLVENASAEFGVLFLGHPHENGGFWQEASIQTCPTAPPPDLEIPTIQVTDEDLVPGAMDTITTAARAEHECIPFEGFCKRISHRHQDLLRLSTRDDKLVYHRRSNMSREWLAQREAVPLASLFARSDLYLSDKFKAILAMLAAKATWQFYDSDLLAHGLTSENVQFIYEKRPEATGVFINEPMLLTQYTGKDGTSSGDVMSDEHSATHSMETIHDMPRILALGILLLELETRKSMKKHRQNPRLCPPGPFGINTDYKIACKLCESIISDIQPLSPLKKILPLCITPRSLESKIRQNLSARSVAKSASKVNKQNALRSVVYSELVRPLEDWVKQFDKLDHIKPLYEVSDDPAGPRPERPLNQPQTASQANTTANVAENNKLREDSRKWFERYTELRNVLQPRSDEKRSGHKAVKIAVLDTGISQDLYDWYRAYPGSLEYEDFVDPARPDKDTTSDGTGHGSAALMLLDKMWPDATYYVARVLKTNVATQTDVDLIVKGINWAISQRVDIITMAIGFKETQPDVVQAVDRAHKQDILIFSAASNERKLDNVCCPANVTDKVFGMYSTDAGIYASRSLNPARRGDSFAIFGEGVEVEAGQLLRRGTSYSTSIAAGLAAAVLDFSRQDRGEDDRSTLSQLRSRSHMQGVFREMAETDNEYLCLRPWSLLKSGNALAKDNEVARKQQRAWIRGTIERRLQPEKLGQVGRS